MEIKSEKLLSSFSKETTTIWSFPERGNWATHTNRYRGNFAPQIPRNLILNYTKETELILDPMVGSGTSLIEARLLNRNAIGIDINPKAVELTKEAIQLEVQNSSSQKVILDDALHSLKKIGNEYDLIILHPPYFNIIKYSDSKILNDFSTTDDFYIFCKQIEQLAQMLFQFLKPNKHLALLIGDTRKGKHYIPISFYLLQIFLKTGFILKEEIIKIQHNCSSSRYWEIKSSERDFYLIMHEHLFVFRKPANGEDTSKLSLSKYWVNT